MPMPAENAHNQIPMPNEFQIHIIKFLCQRIPTSPTVGFSKGPACQKVNNVYPKGPANFAKRITCIRGSRQLSRIGYVQNFRPVHQSGGSRAGNQETHVAAQRVATDPRTNCIALIECDRSALALREKCTYGQVGATPGAKILPPI